MTFWGCEETEEEKEPNSMIGTWDLTISGLFENNNCTGEVDYDAIVLTSNAYPTLEFQDLYDSGAELGGQPICSDGKDCGYLVTNYNGAQKAWKYYPNDGNIYIDSYTFNYKLSSDEMSFDFSGQANNYDSSSEEFKCFNFVYEKN